MRDREKYTAVPTLNGGLRIWTIRFDEKISCYKWILSNVEPSSNVTSSPEYVRVQFFDGAEWNSARLKGCEEKFASMVVLSGVIQIDFEGETKTFGPGQLNGACFSAVLRDDRDPEEEIFYRWRTIRQALALQFPID